MKPHKASKNTLQTETQRNIYLEQSEHSSINYPFAIPLGGYPRNPKPSSLHLQQLLTLDTEGFPSPAANPAP